MQHSILAAGDRGSFLRPETTPTSLLGGGWSAWLMGTLSILEGQKRSHPEGDHPAGPSTPPAGGGGGWGREMSDAWEESHLPTVRGPLQVSGAEGQLPSGWTCRRAGGGQGGEQGRQEGPDSELRGGRASSRGSQAPLHAPRPHRSPSPPAPGAKPRGTVPRLGEPHWSPAGRAGGRGLPSDPPTPTPDSAPARARSPRGRGGRAGRGGATSSSRAPRGAPPEPSPSSAEPRRRRCARPLTDPTVRRPRPRPVSASLGALPEPREKPRPGKRARGAGAAACASQVRHPPRAPGPCRLAPRPDWPPRRGEAARARTAPGWWAEGWPGLALSGAGRFPSSRCYILTMNQPQLGK